MRSYRKIVFILALAGSAGGLLAQDAPRPVRHIELGPEATHPWISDMIQDRQGFIWIGTQYGLYRHDGVHINRYFERSNPPLSSNVVTALTLDNADRLWIGTSRGVNILLPGKDNIVSLRDISGDVGGPVAETYITRLFCDSEGTVWIGMRNNRLCAFRQDSMLYLDFTFDSHQGAAWRCHQVNTFVEDPHGDIWVKTICDEADRLGVFRVNDSDDELTYRVMFETELAYQHLILFNQRLLFTSRNAIHELDYDRNHFDLKYRDWWNSPTQFNPSYVIPDGDQIVVGTWDGELIHCGLADTTAELIELQRPVDSYIRAILKDESKTLWLGTNDGVFTASDRVHAFRQILRVPGVSDPAEGNRMRGMLEYTDGRIYMASYNGMFSLDEQSGEVTQLTTYVEDAVPRPYALAAGEENFFWASSDGGGLFRFYPEGAYFESIAKNTPEERVITSNSILDLYWDPLNILWLGTSSGLSYYDPDEETFHIVLDQNGHVLLSDQKVYDIASQDGRIFWLATTAGLFRLRVMIDEGTRSFQLNAEHALPFKMRELLLATGDILWIATEGNGLIRFNTGSGELRRFTQEHGLCNNTIYSMIAGSEHELWLGTYEGLARFDTETHHFRNFYTPDGLPHREFNTLSRLYSSTGNIYMGTQNGVVVFEPFAFASDSTDLPIMLHRYSKRNLRTDSVVSVTAFQSTADPIVLSPKDNAITFEFGLADYNNPESNRYSYLIEGLSNHWQYLGSQSSLTFPTIPPGEYVLRIRAAGSDGRWSRNELQIPLIAKAPFYKTPWFSLLILFFLAGVGFLIHRYRVRELLRLQRLRMDIASDLHDELGSSLTSIGMQSELLRAGAGDKGVGTNERLDHIIEESQDAVSMLSDIVWSVKSDKDEFGDLMDRVQEHAHYLLAPRKINYRIALPEEERSAVLRQEVRQNSYLIYKEAVHNIAKHSDATEVRVELAREGERLKLLVADNGTPRPGKASFGGNGIRNMKMRAAKMGGVLEIDRRDGYNVSLEVPKAFRR